MGYLLIQGDCRRGLVDLSKVDAVVSDPPYGMQEDTDRGRFRGGRKSHGNGGAHGRTWGAPVIGDDRSFDPAPWLEFRKVILWGSNHFAARLPVGTTLVWIKRNDPAFGSFLSDAEVGWMKGGHGVYCHRDLSMYAIREARIHPTQKPIGLMRWCIRRLNLEPGSLILDPYMGSGSTIIAALAEGHRAIGIEIDRRYCEIARRRIERPHAPIPRPGREKALPLFART